MLLGEQILSLKSRPHFEELPLQEKQFMQVNMKLILEKRHELFIRAGTFTVFWVGGGDSFWMNRLRYILVIGS